MLSVMFIIPSDIMFWYIWFINNNDIHIILWIYLFWNLVIISIFQILFIWIITWNAATGLQKGVICKCVKCKGRQRIVCQKEDFIIQCSNITKICLNGGDGTGWNFSLTLMLIVYWPEVCDSVLETACHCIQSIKWKLLSPGTEVEAYWFHIVTLFY